MARGSGKIRVLVVDDSALVRSVLQTGLARDPALEVVGVAADPYEARDMLVTLRPDVITLDVEMPRMDGVTFLRKYMAVLPTPTIVLSSLTTEGSALALDALSAGAVEVLLKPASAVSRSLEAMLGELIAHVKAAANTQVHRRPEPPEQPSADLARLAQTTDRVIGLGASTGGVAAFGRILPAFPPWTPGIVIVQHMPAGFTRDFAARLDVQCQMKIAEAKDGDRIMRGHVLVAPGGDQHLSVRRFGGEYRVQLARGTPVAGHVPSVDVFFASLAEQVGQNACGVLLTGMGADGAEGLLQLRRAGGHTLIQDRATSAVWGMPAAAEALQAAERSVPLEAVPARVIDWVAGIRAATG